MIHNYESMFDGDLIKHFNIWYATHWMKGDYHRQATQECEKDIIWYRENFVGKGKEGVQENRV